MATEKYDYLFKILLAGDPETGKSNVLSRIGSDTFTDSYISTVGVDFKIKVIDDDGKVKLQLWDTAGQERFRTITRSYYRGAQAVAIVFDVTNKNSFDTVKPWMDEIRKYNTDAKMFLLGNKCDLSNERVVSPSECATLAYELGLEYFDISAKTGSNIESTFLTISRRLRDVVAEPPKLRQVQKKAAVAEDFDSDEEGDEEENPFPILSKDASDNEVLEAVGDPSTIIEYIVIIKRLYFDLQDQRQKCKKLKKRL